MRPTAAMIWVDGSQDAVLGGQIHLNGLCPARTHRVRGGHRLVEGGPGPTEGVDVSTFPYETLDDALTDAGASTGDKRGQVVESHVWSW